MKTSDSSCSSSALSFCCFLCSSNMWTSEFSSVSAFSNSEGEEEGLTSVNHSARRLREALNLQPNPQTAARSVYPRAPTDRPRVSVVVRECVRALQVLTFRKEQLRSVLFQITNMRRSRAASSRHVEEQSRLPAGECEAARRVRHSCPVKPGSSAIKSRSGGRSSAAAPDRKKTARTTSGAPTVTSALCDDIKEHYEKQKEGAVCAKEMTI